MNNFSHVLCEVENKLKAYKTIFVYVQEEIDTN